MIVGFMAAAGFLSLSLLLLIKFFEDKRTLDKRLYRNLWQTKIMPNLYKEGGRALAVIEADKLLDKALKERGLRGGTMGERLVSAGPLFSDKDAVWGVHKLRNKLVHEVGVEVSKVQAKRALAIFARALKDVGAL